MTIHKGKIRMSLYAPDVTTHPPLLRFTLARDDHSRLWQGLFLDKLLLVDGPLRWLETPDEQIIEALAEIKVQIFSRGNPDLDAIEALFDSTKEVPSLTAIRRGLEACAPGLSEYFKKRIMRRRLGLHDDDSECTWAGLARDEEPDADEFAW
jgi:hypothetical protein